MLIVVRHGQTAANAAGLLLGRSDPALDGRGRRQADALAACLAPELMPPGSRDVPGPRIVSSPLTRAVETAEALRAALSDRGAGEVDVEIDDRWIELDYGVFDGEPAGAVPAEVWERWRDDAGYAPPDGESLRDLRTRVESVCEADLLDARDRDLVVVTHVSPIKAAVGWALGVGQEVNWRTFVAPASITRIAVGPAGPMLRSFNEIAHLAGA